MRRMSAIALFIVAVAAVAACDEGYAVWFRNDSDENVIVQFIDVGDGFGTGFPVRAGSIGGSYMMLGPTTWSAHVRVVTSDDCGVLWEGDVQDSPSGAVSVDASGGVSLVTSGPEAEPAASQVPVPAVRETNRCLPNGVEFSPLDPNGEG